MKNERIEILFQDEHICVINKPEGLLSVPYPGSRAKTAQSVLEDILRKKGALNSKHRPFAVHRLDRETSGVMMFALNEQARTLIMEKWHAIVTERLYRAVAENPKNKILVLPDSGLIDDNLAYNARNVGFVPKNGSLPDVKTVVARTHYTVIERGKTHTLFELSLDTGKKNQIRAHLAGKGYPLAGDENYRAKTDNFSRLCLHARTLEFIHPWTNEKMRFEVEEPRSWLEYVRAGDSHPKTPVWIEKVNGYFDTNRGAHFHGKKNAVSLGKKRVSKKDRAHKDFIQQGKEFR